MNETYSEIKKLEAELQNKKDAVISELLKQREGIDKQLAELGWTKPKQVRAKRGSKKKEG